MKASSRHAGVLFGPDITKKFLEHNKLKLIIRSHECVNEGIRVSCVWEMALVTRSAFALRYCVSSAAQLKYLWVLAVAKGAKSGHCVLRIKLQRLLQQGTRHWFAVIRRHVLHQCAVFAPQGAILILSDNLTMTTYTYDSLHGADTSQRARLSLHHTHIIELLQDRICVAKPKLFQRFTELDVLRRGYVSVVALAAAVRWW